MLVSIVMSVYRGADMLPAALRSLEQQSHRDIEVIVIDDCSPDHSAAVVEEFAARDDRFKLVRNESNLGLAASLAKGVQLARGTYVARLDHDDIARSDRIEQQVAYLEAHPEIGVVGSLYSIFRETIDDAWISPAHDANYGSDRIRDGRTPLAHPSVCFRRELVELHGTYDPAWNGAEDHDLFARWYVAGVRFAVLPERLIYYRVHPGSITYSKARHVVRLSLGINLRLVFRDRLRLSARGYRYVLAQLAYMASGDLASRLRGRRSDVKRASS